MRCNLGAANANKLLRCERNGWSSHELGRATLRCCRYYFFYDYETNDCLLFVQMSQKRKSRVRFTMVAGGVIQFRLFDKQGLAFRFSGFPFTRTSTTHIEQCRTTFSRGWRGSGSGSGARLTHSTMDSSEQLAVGRWCHFSVVFTFPLPRLTGFLAARCLPAMTFSLPKPESGPWPAGRTVSQYHPVNILNAHPVHDA